MKDELYVDWDDDSQLWCIFGTETGFCYGTYADEGTANERCVSMTKA